MKLECDVIRDLLPLYAEKLASPASSALVEQHLAACPACRAELEQMEKPQIHLTAVFSRSFFVPLRKSHTSTPKSRQIPACMAAIM